MVSIHLLDGDQSHGSQFEVISWMSDALVTLRYSLQFLLELAIGRTILLSIRLNQSISATQIS